MIRRLAPVLLALAMLAACGGSEEGYGGDFEAGFLDSCQAAAGSGRADVCQCTYDRLEESVPFERAERLDRRLQEEPESALPDDIAQLISTCVAFSVPPSISTTTTSTTAPAGETTDTTAATEGDGSTTTTTAEAG